MSCRRTTSSTSSNESRSLNHPPGKVSSDPHHPKSLKVTGSVPLTLSRSLISFVCATHRFRQRRQHPSPHPLKRSLKDLLHSIEDLPPRSPQRPYPCEHILTLPTLRTHQDSYCTQTWRICWLLAEMEGRLANSLLNNGSTKRLRVLGGGPRRRF